MNRNPKTWRIGIPVLLISTLMTIFLLLLAARSGAAQQGSGLKVIAQKDVLDEKTEGIVLWHDYGSFGLYRVTDESWQQLPESVRLQVQRLDSSEGLFVGNKLAEMERFPNHQREGRALSNTKSLQLVQFVGPIKEEWLTAVEETGAELVQYIANYGYMVWADDNSKKQINRMAEQGIIIEQTMPLFTPLKLGPSLNVSEFELSTDDELTPVTIQLYRHDAVRTSEQIVEDLLVEISTSWEFVLNFQNISGVVRKSDLDIIADLPETVWIGESFPRELNDEVQGQIMANNLTPDQTAPLGPGYLSWLRDLGLSTDPNSYPIVDITDDGIGNGVADDAGGDVTLRELGDPSKPSRMAYIANCTAAFNGAGPDGHGHLNVSIAGGYDERSGFPYQDSNGYQLGTGINPFGRFAGTRVFDEEFDISACGGSDQALLRETYNRGARIVSNSWGCSACAGFYDNASQVYDAAVRDADSEAEGNQELFILFSAGNNGPDPNTIGTPGNGKNVTTVGASENVRPTWTDGCGITPSGADSAQDIATFSSRGPAPEGRTKPDVVAPGTHVQGTASTATNYNGFGVCDPYHPAGQEVFAASSGTSHSVPAVAGYASLIYGFLQQRYETMSPSPALLKAFIIAHTTYLNGDRAGGDLPSQVQGYGLTDMKAAFDGLPKVILDQDETVLFDSSGETWTKTFSVVDPSQPVRIVMAFTDQPGAVGSKPQVNDLNLSVRADGVTYLGNQMKGQWSSSGGTADRVNTVEAVFLPSINSGIIQIEVTAFNIAGDGVPGVGDMTDQDFALVCSNCTEQSDFVINVQPRTSGICLPGAAEFELELASVLGFSDAVTLDTETLPAGVSTQFSKNPVTPTDTSIVRITASNASKAGSYVIGITGKSAERIHTSSVMLGLFTDGPGSPELLQPTDGSRDLPAEVVLSWTTVSQAGTYEVQIASDPDFEQILEEAAGLSEATFQTTELQPGQIYYWRVRAINTCDAGVYTEPSVFITKPVPGVCPYDVTPVVLYANDFEGSASDWSHRGIADQWTLSEERSHSGSTSFFAPNLEAVSDQRLESPQISLPPYQGPLTLQFWNYQSFEENAAQENACFDGAILEISLDDGLSWQQLGSSISNQSVLISDPYDGIISPIHGNPLAGKPAWCGNPQDWLNSVIRIDEYAGESVRFRFRLGTDISVGQDSGHEGWYIDDVLVQECQTLIYKSFLPVFAP